MVIWVERLRQRARANWHPFLRAWFWGQVAVVWTCAQVLPEDVLDRLPILESICAPIVGAVAYIPGYIGRSSFPEVTELIISVGWLIAPLNLLYGLLFPEYLFKTKPRLVFGRLSDLKPETTGITTFFFAALFMLVLIPVLLATFLTVPIFDPNFKYGVTDDLFYSHSNRPSFGLAAQVMSNGMGWLAAYWAVLAGHFLGSLTSMFRK